MIVIVVVVSLVALGGGAVAGGQALTDATLILEGLAATKPPERLNLRVADDDGTIYIDTGRPDGQTIRIRQGRWTLTERAPVRFLRTKLTGAMPLPAQGGNVEKLWDFVNVDFEDRPVLLAALVAALVQTDVPHPILALFAEQGSGWWPMLIGPVLIGAILLMEALGPGQVHWPVMIIFFIVITGPTYLFITAARTYASVELTDRTLRCGTRRINLADIAKIYPPNTGNDYKDWEKATALGELPAVPRGRKGIGIRMVNGKLAQAWARDVERLRIELTEAHLAVKMGL